MCEDLQGVRLGAIKAAHTAASRTGPETVAFIVIHQLAVAYGPNGSMLQAGNL